jgi:hypothetical protein
MHLHLKLNRTRTLHLRHFIKKVFSINNNNNNKFVISHDKIMKINTIN